MKKSAKSHLNPTSPVTLITAAGINRLEPAFISKEVVGEKAYGLASLPPFWTLPFVVVSKNLLSEFAASNKNPDIIKNYSDNARKALIGVGLSLEDHVIIRSSGTKEGMSERGRFYSETGELRNLDIPIAECLSRLLSDPETKDETVPVIVQKFARVTSCKGHLSNERRFKEEARDWLGQIENLRDNQYFSINLRNWRKRYTVENALDEELTCNLRERISEVLKIPCSWAYSQSLRVHFEWVWDGSHIYLVQADEEQEVSGVDPTRLPATAYEDSAFVPKILTPITETHASQYHKVRNVFTYQQLGLPTTSLYALDNQEIINAIAVGEMPSNVEDDVSELVKRSLVIRVDINTSDKSQLQLLPRTHEVRAADEAITWLCATAAQVRKTFPTEKIVFLFHNFIPAVSSVFAYAIPGHRKVQIEALWGLPEGLYYNSHDKYVVDTHKPNLSGISLEDVPTFGIIPRIRCKPFCVVPEPDGRWVTKRVSSKFQWKEAVQDRQWVAEIAFHSRRIAEQEMRPLSIMWFVGVPPTSCSKPIFPWFHETLDAQLMTKPVTQRKKTPFDITFVIRTSLDLEKLREEAITGQKRIRMIRIQPTEEQLLRDKNTLKVIGELARKIEAVILLEGGVLSHAYYQLMQTRATIEVVDPFEGAEEKREFYKLVRDKVPDNIVAGGEHVRTAKLSGSSLLRALREKLVEEAFEVLDAVEQDSILAELADVTEVVDGILETLSSSREDLRILQERKRAKAGGFTGGLILLQTSNPSLTKTNDDSSLNLFEEAEQSCVSVPMKATDIFELAHSIMKWSDRRDHPAAKEVILKLDLPFVRDSWAANAPEVVVEANPSTTIRVEITGKREGARIQIQLSIYQTKLASLFDSAK